MSDKPIYLDYAAATPLDNRVLEAMLPYFSDIFYNPSATYLSATDTAKKLQAARSTIAGWLGARTSEIIFTAGGTESNNLAVQGVLRSFPGAHAVVSAIEHESVLEPANLYGSKLVPVNIHGIVNLESLRAAIDDNTVLVSVMYANNEVGSIQPLSDVSTIIGDIRKQRRSSGNKLPLYFHTDAAQASNFLDLHAARLGVDMMTLNGGKIYGPKQSGILYVHSSVNIKPLILGGGQERGLRSGTENVAAAIGLSVALQIAQTTRHEETNRLRELQTDFFKRIDNQIPGAVINGSIKKRLPNNLHITMPNVDNEKLLIQLDEAGILAAAGSACSASNQEPSHVLRAMGRTDQAARSSIRLTMGRATTQADLEKTLVLLVQFSN